jgi:hypothetical protein
VALQRAAQGDRDAAREQLEDLLEEPLLALQPGKRMHPCDLTAHACRMRMHAWRGGGGAGKEAVRQGDQAQI